MTFSPKEILFIDHSSDALEYMSLIVELISFCNTNEEFISRIFSRSIKSFLQQENTLLPFSKLYLQRKLYEEPYNMLKQSLNEFTQWSYLATPFDASLLEETLAKCSLEGRLRFDIFLRPHLCGHVLFEHVKCKRLLPCWPLNEPVPFSHSNPMQKNLYGEYEPNTNTFYYGNLWLTNTETFLAVKQKLEESKPKFILSNTSEEALKRFINPKLPAALYAGNIDKNTRAERKKNRKETYQGNPGFLCIITANDKPFLINDDNLALGEKFSV